MTQPPRWSGKSPEPLSCPTTFVAGLNHKSIDRIDPALRSLNGARQGRERLVGLFTAPSTVPIWHTVSGLDMPNKCPLNGSTCANNH